MARENFVICNRAGCGKRVSPPDNAGWVVLMIVSPNGLEFADSLGDICIDCRAELMRFVNTSPKKVQLQ
jgi:hypothetical protein